MSRTNSTRSDSRSGASKRRYQPPRTVLDFASQAADVCTRLLNGRIDLPTAQAYAGVARVVSQALTAELSQSRFLKAKPDLRLRPLEEDDEDDEA